jgi:flagellar biosynthetic protein FliQ
MTESVVINVSQEAMRVTLLVVGPMLLVSMLVGLTVSVLQAATQITEQSLTFVPKILAVGVTLAFTGSWVMQKLVAFMVHMFNLLPSMVH